MISCRCAFPPRNAFSVWGLLTVVVYLVLFGTASGQVYEKVVSFPPNAGNTPMAPLTLGSDGNFYGTAEGGGAYNVGAIFKITPSGTFTTLVSLSTATGDNPKAGLILGPDGNFYGTTSAGGTGSDYGGDGTVFKITPGGTYNVLYNFSGGSDGKTPLDSLVLGVDGNFYGTTQAGGTGSGTIFKISPTGSLTTIFSFSGSNGAGPAAGLTSNVDGTLFYGTTASGTGTASNGTIFKVTPAGVLTSLVSFTGTSGSYLGSSPQANLIFGSDGNFHGTTSAGGTSGSGTVFTVSPTGTLTTQVNFNTTNGSSPAGALYQGSDGNYYGTTQSGGDNSFGTIFKVTPAGSFSTLLSLYPSTTGSNVLAGLIQGNDGNFYGTASGGGLAASGGDVFQITPSGSATILTSFSTALGQAVSGLVQAPDGSFLGATRYGLNSYNSTIFRATQSGVLSTVAVFTDATIGQLLQTGLILGQDGNYYGVCQQGGVNGYGSFYKMTPAGVLSLIYSFDGVSGGFVNATGAYPLAELIQAPDGTFYGTTYLGGTFGMGTIFKITAAGVLTKLFEFNGTNGAYPQAPLFRDTDGTLYGTTQQGGSSQLGTVFMLSPAGTLTTLVNFNQDNGKYPTSGLTKYSTGIFYGTTTQGGTSGNGTIFKVVTSTDTLTTLVNFNEYNGFYPESTLILSPVDGNFYGSTTYGGSSNGYGTIFQMTPAGALTTLYDFVNDPIDGAPRTRLIQAADGNLYGTTWGNIGALGCIYRLIFPGSPNVYVNTPVVTVSTAVLSFLVNARGFVTSANLLYGTDGVNFPNSVPITASLSGYQTVPLGTTLSSLASGTTYYYKVVATSSKGTTTTAVQSFSTLAVPSAVTSAATSILPASAQLNGTVNAFNYAAGVVFQYGTDGQNFPNQIGATQGTPAGTITGSGNTAVSAAVAGLAPATTYYYRISATNAGGTTISGTTSFTTLTAPVAAVAPATLVSSQSAQLNGTVNAEGASSTVTIEYGTTNMSFPNSVGATPGTVAGSSTGAVPVSVVISNSASTPLAQGTTYYYRVRAVSAGGTAVSPSASFSLDILSGFARQFPNAPSSAQGIVLVNLSPSGLNTGWRFAGEQLWRASGVPAFGLVTGNYTIQYEPVPGYLQPPPQTFSVVSGGAATVDNETYYPAAAGGPSGGLSVQLVPQNLTGTGWRFYGESAWRANNSTVSNLVPGNYLVQCEPVAYQTTPAIASVAVTGGQTSIVTLTYLAANPVVGAQQPAMLSFATVTNSQTPSLPYAFVGQIRSDEGSATGFVVSERVVATAGHVVFDGVTNAYVTGLQWLFERSAGTYEPVPQIPQGAYLFDGYAALAHADAQAAAQSGSSSENASPAAQNLDAAALYFFADAGNGGYGGYLASVSNPNEFLASVTGTPNNRLKTLVGYPVDGISAANQGQMFATPPVVATFTQVAGTDSSGDPDTNGKPYQLYTTSGLTSVGGNSGGPLCVQYDDGNYYPAAIYLGGSGQAVVRAIDSAVIDLFNRAQVSGAGGANQVGGGVTQANTTISGGSFATSSLLVNFAPGPVAAAASWMLGSTSGTARGNGVQLNNLSPGNYTLYFTSVSGYIAPAASVVTLTGGQLTTVTVTYEGITAQPQNVTAATGASATFAVAASGTPTAYQWQKNSVNVSGATSSTYTRPSVATSDAGSYNVMVTWSNGSMSSSTAALNVSSALTAQTITFSALANKAFGAAPFALTASASSGLAVTYNVLSGPATVSGSTLTLTGTGTVVVQASQSGNATYASAAMVSQNFNVSAAIQAITFPAIASQPLSVAPFLLNATANSGLPVSFSLVSGPASLQGNTLSVTGAGTVVVQASQPGNSNFAAAANVNQSFLVGPAPINDTPTLPAWALALLALFFVLSGASHLTRCLHISPD